MEIMNNTAFAKIDSHSIENKYKHLVLNSSNLDFEITQDIVNERGTLLVPSGKSVDQTMYNKILDHKLLKPIDDYLRFANQITADSLIDNIVTLCESILADTVYDFEKSITTIREIVAQCEYDNVVMNKLTVFSNDRENHFNHSLTTAFVSTEIGRSFNYTEKQLSDIFNAALFHDIGEMFIDEELYNKDVLSDEEFKAIKVHPVIGYIILKESKTNFSNDVLNAVLNHHEQINGQGYPRGLSQNQLGPLERILAVADTFDALQRKNRSIDDSIWILKSQSSINSISGDSITPTHDPDVVSNLIKTIRNEQSNKISPEKVDHLQQLVHTLFNDLQSVTQEVSHIWESIKNLIKSDGNTGLSKTSIDELHDNMFKLNHMILGSSGIGQVDFVTFSESEPDLISLRRDMERLAPEMTSKVNSSMKYITNEMTTEFDKKLAKSIERLQAKIQQFNHLLRKQLH